jgi:hypothetical protein
MAHPKGHGNTHLRDCAYAGGVPSFAVHTGARGPVLPKSISAPVSASHASIAPISGELLHPTDVPGKVGQKFPCAASELQKKALFPGPSE